MRKASLLVGSWIVCGAWLVAAPAVRAADTRPGALTTIALPGGADALASAAGLPVPAPRATVALEVIRRLHAGSDSEAAAAVARRQAVAAVLAQPASADTIPMPFDDGVWSRIVFSRKVPPAGVAAAIVTTPRAAWFYYGAVGLDDETRAWFRERPHRLLLISAQVGAFAAFGPSLRIHEGRVDAPGGPAADPLWKALVGESPANAEKFVDALLGARAGRVAWLYDTVARLDAGMQKHLLEGDGNVDRMRRLADAFTRVNPEWRIEDRPLWRPLVDPAALLLELEASPDGSIVLPAAESWAGTLGRVDRTDASWLIDRVFTGDQSALRDRFDLALFAMRWTRDGREPAARGALDLFANAPALALTLERLGVRDNAVATRLHGLLQKPAMREDTLAMPLVQASLALVERATLAGSIDAGVAGGVLTALADRVEADGAGRGVAAWLQQAFVPAIARLAPAETIDDQLAAALSGPTAAEPVRVEWEGQRYVADRAAATRARIERVREAQGRPSVARAVEPGRPAAGSELADALVALIYASVLPATEPELLASKAETRHDFGPMRGPGSQERRAWRLAEATSAAGTPWHLSGSLLGLDVALAVQALRRVSDDPPSPTLPGADRVAFARTVALLRASALTDASRDTALRLIAAGRRRLAAVSSLEEARALAQAAGLSAWRREALAWAVANEPSSVAGALSVSELAWAGAPQSAADRAALDAWGTGRLGTTGELATRAPRGRGWEGAVAHDARAGLATSVGDLTLRIAAFLAARGLPASLAPDLLSAATLDLIDRVPAPRADDWRAVVGGIRAMSDTRLEDDVAALTADGPLRPVREPGAGQ